jgi:hypothetical protein
MRLGARAAGGRDPAPTASAQRGIACTRRVREGTHGGKMARWRFGAMEHPGAATQACRDGHLRSARCDSFMTDCVGARTRLGAE